MLQSANTVFKLYVATYTYISIMQLAHIIDKYMYEMS